MRNFSEEEFGRIFASQKPGFAGFRFAPFFALCAKNASRPYNPLRGLVCPRPKPLKRR
jgi:hypothetical protein